MLVETLLTLKRSRDSTEEGPSLRLRGYFERIRQLPLTARTECHKGLSEGKKLIPQIKITYKIVVYFSTDLEQTSLAYKSTTNRQKVHLVGADLTGE